MGKIYVLLVYLLIISFQLQAQKVPDLTREVGKDLFNKMNGPLWIVKMKDGSTKTISEDWMQELRNTDRVIMSNSGGGSYGGYAFETVDMANVGIIGSMPELCFSRDWSKEENIVPSGNRKYWDNSSGKDRRISEDKNKYACF